MDDDAATVVVTEVVGDVRRVGLLSAHEGPQGHEGEGELDAQGGRPDSDAARDALYGEEVLGLKGVDCSEYLVPGDLRAGKPPVLVSGELLKSEARRRLTAAHLLRRVAVTA
nr:hypothetical protein OH837_34280 [Streptomyces canus]